MAVYGGLGAPGASSGARLVAAPGGAVVGAGSSPDVPRTSSPGELRGVLNVVAHPDDDLLFLSPALVASVRSGDPVHTVFMTAGDAGTGARYWRRRERGVRAAYATMAAVADRWAPASDAEPTCVTLILSASPQVRLSFVRLPDGGHGQGYERNSYQSLSKLWTGQQARIAAVDRSAAFSRTALVDLLARVMVSSRPAVVRTQDFTGAFGDGDHDDHHAVAYLTREAARRCGVPQRLESYLGYPIIRRPANVTGGLLTAKSDAFTAYARHDRQVCRPSDPACSARAYPAWLQRQYVSVAGLS
jgi:LmbE family N-acetylglucosaminyl deacetylase